MGTNQKQLLQRIQQGKERLARLTGQKRVVYLLKLLKIARLHSAQTATDLIDENLSLIESSDTEEAALLLSEKAYFASKKPTLDAAKVYVDKALSLARKIGSKEAEVKALTVKGYLKDTERQHKQAAAWHLMAYEKSSQLQKPNAALELGTSYGKQGEYDRAWIYISEAIRISQELTRSKSISVEDKLDQLRIQAEAWSRLATLSESIDDFDGAERAYGKSQELAKRHGFIWEQYKTLSRQVKFFIGQKRLPEAEQSLIAVQKLSLAEHGPRAPLYIAHDWARLRRAQLRYEEAFEKYEELLYGTSADKEDMDRHLSDLITNTADLFSEIVDGVRECLIRLDKERLAEMLYLAARAYEEVLTEGGIYKEIEKQSKMEITRNELLSILDRIFQKRPWKVRYKDIVAEYDPDKEKARVIKDGQELELNKRAFLILKFLDDNRGECVTRRQLEEFWLLHGEAHQSKKGEEAGVRAYIQRDLRGKLGLAQFIEKCPKPKGGWRLTP